MKNVFDDPKGKRLQMKALSGYARPIVMGAAANTLTLSI
jgi:hypothetical protein